MAYQPYTVEGFGGLNIRDDPGQVGAGGAIDLSNVIVDASGTLKSRPGYAAFGSSLANMGTSTGCLLMHMNPLNQAVDPFFTVVSQDGTDTKVWTLAEDGTTSTSATLTNPVTSDGGSGWIRFSPSFKTDSFAHIATGAGAFRVSANGTSAPIVWAIPDGGSYPRYLARTQASDRLVAANFASATASPTGADGSTSTVFFSNPGAYNIWGSDNWVDVGETITAVVSWNDQVFIFGTRSLFVFYGESTDSTGGVVFDYRPVAMEVGTTQDGTVGQAACAGPDGVYFATSQGIWRTTGGGPVKVSRPVDPILTGDFLGAGVASVDKIDRLMCAGERLFVSYGVDSDAGGLTLVYDVPSGQWSRWDVGEGSVPIARLGSTREDDLYYADTTATKVMRFDPDLGTDNGTDTSWRYQSGWYDLGHPQTKFVGNGWITGTGTPTFALLADYATTDSQAAAVTLGTTTQARADYVGVRQGRMFSHKLSGTGQATISQLGHNLVGIRNR